MKNLKKVMGGGHRRLAFTLAEVLITLAIIGVVAALTIPTVISKYQKHHFYTAFMKMYNTLEAAISLSSVDNGTPNGWAYDDENPLETLEKYIYPYLKISKTCEESQASECADYNITFLGDSSSQVPASNLFFGYGPALAFLEDGSTLLIGPEGSYGGLSGLNFIVDINGKKGPNVMGRDIFWLIYTEEDGKWKFMGDDGEQYSASECDPGDENAMGLGCGLRLIQEGKMSY